MEYITIVQGWLLELLNAAQWHIYVLTLIVVSVLMEIIKRFFALKAKDATIIYRGTVLTGVIVTIGAFFTATVAQPIWYWGFTGITVGHVSNWLYRKTSPLIFRTLYHFFPWLEKRKVDRTGEK